MLPARALMLLCAAAAGAQEIKGDGVKHFNLNKRTNKAIASSLESPRGCLYGGRWHAAGGLVRARSPCLRCACVAGALHCARRACAALPDPPPHRCHVLHRKDACCPELHCPDSIVNMEQGASARFDNEDFPEYNAALSFSRDSCTEGGSVFAAGSAMESSVSCEQCFCLRGERRCVRPRCLPPPPHCRPRHAPGACCPQRYYCDHEEAQPTHGPNDCVVAGSTFPEGFAVPSAATCSACFCLRGAVRCQALSCAAPPPLLGCTPLLRKGECCAHRYQCHHGNDEELVDLNKEMAVANLLMTHNALTSVTVEDRSFHKSKSTKSDNNATYSTSTTLKEDTTAAVPSFKLKNSVNKVKRKTNDQDPITSSSRKPIASSTSTKVTTSKVIAASKASTTTTTENPISTTEIEEEKTLEQPESSVKVVINGTINCTTAYSSSAEPVNYTAKDEEKIIAESLLRTPNIDRMDTEEHTFNPNDIITDRNVNGGFDDNETFTINVTSSLRTNTSHSAPGAAVPGVVEDVVAQPINVTKTKEEYDYDYTEPTLPPSLPNLKIIPFVAADAVVDDDNVSPKDILTYPILEREDKFPIYYPKEKETLFATRREDVYHANNYPTFTADRPDSELPTSTDEEASPNSYPSVNDIAAAVHQYTVAASLGNLPPSHHPSASKSETKQPGANFKVEKPAINLFSPPVETEGGFVPKGPGIMDEYYAVYPSTHAPSNVPHLTTSMQLDTSENESCTLSDGRRLPAGATVHVTCSLCACASGALHCLPRACAAAAGRPCTRPAAAADPCCPALPCEPDKETTQKASAPTTTKMSLTTSAAEGSVTDTIENLATRVTEKPEVLHTEANGTTITNNYTMIPSTAETKPMKEYTESNFKVNSQTEIKHKLTSTYETTTASERSTEPTIASISTMITISDVSTMTTTDMPAVEQEEDQHHSQEYDEEEEEEDEGFSFGNVLKLLLSETYDTTTAPPYRKRTTTTFSPNPSLPPPLSSRPSESRLPLTAASRPSTDVRMPPAVATRIPPALASRAPSTVSRILPSLPTKLPPPSLMPTIAPFIPLPALPPHRPLYSPHKTVFSPTSVNRIDHLVLGEATAIKRPTTKPIVISTTTEKPITTPKITTARVITTPKIISTVRTVPTRKPPSTTRPQDTNTSIKLPDRYVTSEKAPEISRPAAPHPLGVGSDLLKLAGCNIYGRMYRVGRIIAELSNPCQECRCTELGVQCRPLDC